MKKLFMVLPLVFLLCFTFSCQKAEEVAEESVVDVEADVEALKKIEEEWGAAFASGDVEKFLSFYTDDAVNIQFNEPPLIGKEANRGILQQLFDQFTMEVDGTLEDVQVSCDLAFTRGTNTGVRTPKAGGESIKFKTNWVTIYRKQSDGTWKCICNTLSDENLISPIQSEE